MTKKFGDLLVLDDISETIYEGEKVVVIGPSGSGKSTFLHCLNCLEDPTAGKIFFDGVDIADFKVNINEQRQKMGMVFQHFNLYNNKTVLESVQQYDGQKEYYACARSYRYFKSQKAQKAQRLCAA